MNVRLGRPVVWEAAMSLCCCNLARIAVKIGYTHLMASNTGAHLDGKTQLELVPLN